MKKTMLGLVAVALLGGACGKGGVKTDSGPIKRTDSQLMDAYDKLHHAAYDDAKDQLVKQLGDPNKADGDTLTWYAIKPKDDWGPEQCYQLELQPHESSAGPTDAVRCGLK